MASLADTQASFRRALVAGDASGVLPLLAARSTRSVTPPSPATPAPPATGVGHTAARLAIHRRHYEASLVNALRVKFPATEWLVGGPFFTEAARAFVHEHPPCAPCIAEYGLDFPEFLSTRPSSAGVPYLRAFAELEWHLGQVSVAIDRPPAPLEQVARLAIDALMRARLTLQPGLRYLSASWPVDDVMNLYLMDSAPEQFALTPADVRIEIRGARGECEINRLHTGEFVFRQAVLAGLSIADAVECAFDAHTGFDPGQALAALVSARLVTAVAVPTDAGATNAGATKAGATKAGATKAGATNAGATNAVATNAVATDAVSTTARGDER